MKVANMSTSSVTLEQGLLHSFVDFLPELEEYSQFVIITHSRLAAPYAQPLLSALEKLSRPVLLITIPSGERHKTIAQAKRCWDKMAAAGIGRKAALFALGGGVICDLAGFVASCYMRGLNTFLFPTTLLAMVDAAIGGKTAVNLPHAKNGIGTFHFPKHIFIDPSTLSTLPPREFQSGLAEVIKYGMISCSPLTTLLENELAGGIQERRYEVLEELIRQSVSIKQSYVDADPHDLTGKRAALNYGHTFGHAIEAATHYRRFLHGEAVSIGMSCAVTLSTLIGLSPSSVAERQNHLCRLASLPTKLPFHPIEELMQKMKSDKKSVSGRISLILLKGIGEVVQTDTVDPSAIQQAILYNSEKKES